MFCNFFYVFLIILSIVQQQFDIVQACTGCIELDELNFEKIIKRFPVTIVKFDIAFPYGEHHEAYSTFSKDVTPIVDDIIITMVGVKDYGDKDNLNLSNRFAVDKKYPAIKLFQNGVTNKWLNYPSDLKITADNLKKWVRENTDLYIGLPGCIKEFDIIAQEFMANFKSDKTLIEKILESTEKLLDNVKNEEMKKTGNFYYVIMKRVNESDEEFIEKERKRITNLLETKITEAKKIELNTRLNILQAFNEPQINTKHRKSEL